jgi:FkbM family methyltransferase
MIVRYFDFGLYNATELKWIYNILTEISENIELEIELYGFEACNKYYNNIINNKEIIEISKKCKLNIYNVAISDKVGEIKLFHHKNTVGHSIYDTKSSISDQFELVKSTSFSMWLKNNNLDLEKSFNIMRMNIEGAEYPLFIDLINSNIYKRIHIFCGDGRDVSKIREFTETGKDKEYYKLLKLYNIKIHRFIDFKHDNNVNIKELILKSLDPFICFS